MFLTTMLYCVPSNAFNEQTVHNTRKVLFEDFRTWLSDILGIKLESTVDLSCAKYEYTDVLLCHDDELEGRRIAFILYLVPEWGAGDGGTLDLYDADEHNQPQQIAKSLTPSWNTLVFFEVSPVSHHQVSEILSEEKCRLSVSGWFHGPSLARPPRYIESLSPRNPHIASDEEILYDWINPIYLDVSTQVHIQDEFEEKSEILLKNFFKNEKFELVCEALHSPEIKWKRRGPANKRSYDQAEEDGLPDILAKYNNDEDEQEDELEESDGHEHACSSTEKGNKSGLTEDDQRKEGDKIGPNKVEMPGESPKNPSVPVCRGELRHWKNGHYTLIHDTNVENSEFALDLLLYCGCEEDNSLALIYRDKETLKFVKHINQRSNSQCKKTHEKRGFWDFSFVYYE
ncbi:hypothetical protein scyTo_0012949 [Scyliorhinus torazame]|uniref:Prolyl 3-hydroxylase OGFOD1 n=1 Tax=Scyliorhinus torazame TaxID=75743 RepID=A0A401NL60_SCYTO|nr:hypothetical protein [Scyliorhinus torazame]